MTAIRAAHSRVTHVYKIHVDFWEGTVEGLLNATGGAVEGKWGGC